MEKDQTKLTMRVVKGVAVLRINVSSLCDNQIILELRDALEDLIKPMPVVRFVLDMQDVQVMGSRFFGILFHIKARCGEAGRVVLARMNSHCSTSFRIAGLNKSFTAFDSLDDAVDSFEKPQVLASSSSASHASAIQEPNASAASSDSSIGEFEAAIEGFDPSEGDSERIERLERELPGAEEFLDPPKPK